MDVDKRRMVQHFEWLKSNIKTIRSKKFYLSTIQQRKFMYELPLKGN
jgi:hypothetical protein